MFETMAWCMKSTPISLHLSTRTFERFYVLLLNEKFLPLNPTEYPLQKYTLSTTFSSVHSINEVINNRRNQQPRQRRTSLKSHNLRAEKLGINKRV